MWIFLHNNYKIVKDIFDLANGTLKFYLSNLCFSSDVKELIKIYDTQPDLLMVNYVMYPVYIKEKDLIHVHYIRTYVIILQRTKSH